MSTPEQAIALLTCMSRYFGLRSVGTCTVKSTEATGWLPKGVYAFPVIGGQSDFSRPFRSAYVNALGVADGVAIEQAGTVIPITSCLGGGGNNLEAGTRLVWFPYIGAPGESMPDAGPLEASATVDALMTDGAPLEVTSLVQLKSAAWYVDPTLNFSIEMVRAALVNLPGLLVCWSGRGPMNKGHGDKSYERLDRWNVFIVVGRQEAHHTRGMQGLALVDAACDEFVNRASVDGVVFSSPGTRVLGAGMHAIASSFYAYKVQLETTYVKRATDDAQRSDYPAWLRTGYEYPTTVPEQGTHNLPHPLVAGPFTEGQP